MVGKAAMEMRGRPASWSCVQPPTLPACCCVATTRHKETEAASMRQALLGHRARPANSRQAKVRTLARLAHLGKVRTGAGRGLQQG